MLLIFLNLLSLTLISSKILFYHVFANLFIVKKKVASYTRHQLYMRYVLCFTKLHQLAGMSERLCILYDPIVFKNIIFLKTMFWNIKMQNRAPVGHATCLKVLSVKIWL